METALLNLLSATFNLANIGLLLAMGIAFFPFGLMLKWKLKGILDNIPKQTVQFDGSVRLTEFGRKISTGQGVKDWAIEQAKDLFNIIVKKQEDGEEVNESNVILMCRSHVEREIDNDPRLRRRMKYAAFIHDTYEEQVEKVFAAEILIEVIRLLSDEWDEDKIVVFGNYGKKQKSNFLLKMIQKLPGYRFILARKK